MQSPECRFHAPYCIGHYVGDCIGQRIGQYISQYVRKTLGSADRSCRHWTSKAEVEA